MRLLLSLGLLSVLSTSALADDGTPCHVTLKSSSRRLDHHVTSCHANDDTKYDEALETSYQVRSGCTIQMDDSGITIDLDVAEPATGSMQSKQENQGVYGSNATGSTTITGKSGGTITLMTQPSGALLPQASLTFAAKSTGKEHIHSNCDPSKKDYDHASNSDLDALITPFPEVFMHQQDPAAMMTALPTFKISRDAFVKGFASHKPFTVSGSGVYDWKQGNADVHTDVTMNVEIGTGEAAYEAYFIPATGWETFVPEGPALPKTTGTGNTVSLAVELRDKKTGKKSTKKFSVTYGLESSKLGGTCMNWPPIDQGGPAEIDLFFDGTMNKDGTVGDTGRTLDLPIGKGDHQVTVTSRDFGGYARVFAHITTEDGVKLDAMWSDGTNALSIPKDDNKNHIADIWEKEKKVFGKKALDDDEDYPVTIGSKGDGYTLFEEYRGFVQADPTGPLVIRRGSTPKLQHARFDPVRRDVFIGLSVSDPKDDAAILAGVRDYTTVSGFAVHYIARRDVLAPLDGADYSGAFPRRTDLRADSEPELFGKAAVGLWVATDIPTGTNGSPAFARPIAANADSERPFHSPSQVVAVVVSHANALSTVDLFMTLIDPDAKLPPDASEETQNNFAAWHAGAAKFGTPAQHRAAVAKATTELDVLVARMMRFTVTHELGHATGAYHHRPYDNGGNKACPMRYWQGSQDIVMDFLTGKWDATKAYNGLPWAWCSENIHQFNLHE